MTAKLDKKDWRILSCLCEDARMSHQQIARKTKTNKNSVTYKIKRLEKKGVISRFFTLVDIEPLGSVFYTILIKLNTEKAKEFINHIKSNDHITVIDKFVGRWNFLIEFVCKDPHTLFDFLRDIKKKFSDVIDTYEVHPNLEVYTIEQLPVELIKKRHTPPPKKKKKRIILDPIEIKLLQELNKNSTTSLIKLGEKIGVTYKTISSKIRKLKREGIITKFTASISLGALGYDVYLITIDLKNLSTTTESSLKNYLYKKKNIRAAFLSAVNQKVFIYLAVKHSLELQDFIENLNNEFGHFIVDQEYLLSSEQIKYDLFPKGVLE
jgi:Lrp/AsnC family leucine-responsive transcriptional regulator|tara:strand:- start:39 stop:1007 length:969 start_codon:yes stop_codon:yes gene_type:complete